MATTPPSSTPRRGLAMMLVLIGVAVATILAAAYLAGRDNSLAISRNIKATVAARRATMTALDLGLAVLQTESQWRSAPGGVLLDAYPLANPRTDEPAARLTLSAWDLARNTLPAAETEYVRLTALAEADADGDGDTDARQQARLLAYVPRIAGPRAAVDLAEFAAFSDGAINITGRAFVAPWPRAPLSVLGRRVALGTHQTHSSAVTVDRDAACLDCTVYHPDLGGADVVQNQSPVPVRREPMPFAIPFPMPPLPDVADPEPPLSHPDLDLSEGGPATLTSFARFTDIVANLGAEITILGPATVVADNDFMLQGGARVRVSGDVTIVVFNDLGLYGASTIELAPQATLRIFVGQKLVVENSYIGDELAGAGWDHGGNAPYMDPLRVRMYRVEHLKLGGRTWKLRGNSVVKGSLYGPNVLFSVVNESALYGRVAADRITVGDDSAVYYDPALDERAGYPESDSALYNPQTGALSSLVLTLGSLDPPELQGLADTMGAAVHADGTVYRPIALTSADVEGSGDSAGDGEEDFSGLGLGHDGFDDGTPGTSDGGGWSTSGEDSSDLGGDDVLGLTPRTVLVEYTLLEIGSDMDRWEEDATMPGSEGPGP